MKRNIGITLFLLIIAGTLSGNLIMKSAFACPPDYTCTCSPNEWCPFSSTTRAAYCCDNNDRVVGREGCGYEDNCSCEIQNRCADNPPPDQPTPTPTRSATPTPCPNPPAPALSSPANGSTFVLPVAPAQLYVDQVIRGISQSCGPNAPQYDMTFGFVGAGNTFERGWDSSLIWHTGAYNRTGTVNWKAKSRYLDSYYSTYRESAWGTPWAYQIVSPTPIPTATPVQTCDAQVMYFTPCYNSTRAAGSCQDASIRLRGQLTNLGNSTSRISYQVTDYNGTVIYGGESRSLLPGQIWDFNHTELPPDAFGNYPDYGVIYCGGLRLTAACTEKPDTNPLNNQISVPQSNILACQTATPTPTATPRPTATPTITPTVNDWFQTREGDVHAGGKIVSTIPTTAPNRNFSLGGLTNSPGIVSYNGAQSPDFGQGYASNNNVTHWVVKTPAMAKYFSYFYNLVGLPTANFNGGELPRDTGVYYADHDITISSIAGGSVGASKRIVILVRGKVDISIDIDIPASRQSSLIVVASGNINIGSSITKLAGIFLADGTIDSGAGNQQLVVEGAFIARDFSLVRNLGADNRLKPGELFVNRPDFFIYSNLLLWQSSFMSWEELVP